MLFVFKSGSSNSDFGALVPTTQEKPRRVITDVRPCGPQELFLAPNGHQNPIWAQTRTVGRAVGMQGTLILILAGPMDESIGKIQM